MLGHKFNSKAVKRDNTDTARLALKGRQSDRKFIEDLDLLMEAVFPKERDFAKEK